MAERHFPYLWAAYRRGMFGDDLGAGLSAGDFQALLTRQVEAVIQSGNDVFAFVRPDGVVVGMAVMGVTRRKGMAIQAEPRVNWFPEATARNKLECWLRFLVDLKREAVVRIYAERPAWRFYDHLCKYGVLRRVGTLRGFFDSGEDAGEWQGVR